MEEPNPKKYRIELITIIALMIIVAVFIVVQVFPQL
jgi:flagellar basal body-associated protein FliL|tara:strand:+ start:229 stop:336 length:108 start_codon:yes stop_codon:yes gene_type:complete